MYQTWQTSLALDTQIVPLRWKLVGKMVYVGMCHSYQVDISQLRKKSWGHGAYFLDEIILRHYVQIEGARFYATDHSYNWHIHVKDRVTSNRACISRSEELVTLLKMRQSCEL